MSMVIALLIALPLGFLAAVGHRRVSGTVDLGGHPDRHRHPRLLDGRDPRRLVRRALAAAAVGGASSTGATRWWGAFKSLILPAIALGIVQAAILTRYVRSAVLDVMREDYIRTARAKGMTLHQALRRHGVRNAAVPVVTVLGLQPDRRCSSGRS